MKTPEQIITEFRSQLEAIPGKKEKVEAILDFVLIYGDAFGENIFDIFEYGISLSKEIDFKAGEIICYLNLMFFGGITKGMAAQKHNITIQDIVDRLLDLKNDKDWYQVGLNQLAFLYWFRGEYEKAFQIIFEATRSPIGRTKTGLAWNNFALGVFYFDTKDFENSRIHYQKGFEIFEEENLIYGKARATSGLGSVAIMQNRIADAKPLLEYSASIYRELGHHSGLSRAVNDLGLLEKSNKNYPAAIKLLEESIEVRKEIKHLQGLVTSYTELGEVYLLCKNHNLALEQFNTGLQLAIEVKTLQKQMRLYKLLYDTYKELKNTELALENFEKYYEIKSKLLSDEATNNIKKIQTQYEKEKSEKEAEIERLKNVELKKAYQEIEEKNKEIIDSITYARRIQVSLMPNEHYIEKTIKRLREGH